MLTACEPNRLTCAPDWIWVDWRTNSQLTHASRFRVQGWIPRAVPCSRFFRRGSTVSIPSPLFLPYLSEETNRFLLRISPASQDSAGACRKWPTLS